jgi:hypothetical protein
MTYNGLITTISTLLDSHAMINTVRNDTPKEWLMRDEQPVFPVCFFSVNNGNMNKGRERVYNVQFFFLDKSGQEAEFETEVINDQMEVANDILNLIRTGRKDYNIQDSVTFNLISDKYEDFLAGVEYTLNITTQNEYTGCDVPTI